MAHFGTDVEYGLHTAVLLAGLPDDLRLSSRDLAHFQGLSPSYISKLLSRLERGGIVSSVEGKHGGYRLAHPPDQITVLMVVDALDEKNPLFRCREIRQNCTLFEGNPPAWACEGICDINAIMLEAEKKMREVLASHSLADIQKRVLNKIPEPQIQSSLNWFLNRRPPGLRGLRPFT